MLDRKLRTGIYW